MFVLCYGVDAVENFQNEKIYRKNISPSEDIFTKSVWGNVSDIYLEFNDNNIFYRIPLSRNKVKTGFGSYKIDYKKSQIIINNKKIPVKEYPYKSFFIKDKNTFRGNNKINLEIFDKYNNPVDSCLVKIGNIEKLFHKNYGLINIPRSFVSDSLELVIKKEDYIPISITLNKEKDVKYFVFLEKYSQNNYQSSGKTIIEIKRLIVSKTKTIAYEINLLGSKYKRIVFKQ